MTFCCLLWVMFQSSLFPFSWRFSLLKNNLQFSLLKKFFLQLCYLVLSDLFSFLLTTHFWKELSILASISALSTFSAFLFFLLIFLLSLCTLKSGYLFGSKKVCFFFRGGVKREYRYCKKRENVYTNGFELSKQVGEHIDLRLRQHVQEWSLKNRNFGIV